MTAADLNDTFADGIDDGAEHAVDAALYGAGLPADTLTLAARYSDLCDRCRDAEGEVDAVKEQMRAIEPVLLERMQESGTQNVRAGRNTLYVKQTFFVSKRSDVETLAIVERLRTHGLGYLVSEGYNAASLKGKLREMLDDGQEVPTDLAALLNIGTAASLGHRR